MMSETTGSRRVPQPAGWVNHFLSNIDSRFSLAVDINENQPTSPENVKLVETEALFNTAIREYQQMLGTDNPSIGIRVVACQSYEELVAFITEAEAAYTNQAGRIRRATRTIGDYAAGLRAWTGLLPTDNNLSIIGGGVKLLLSAAGRRSAQRERMLATLQNFLDLVSDSEAKLKQYSEDQGLRKSAMFLYMAILKMIEACINSLINESLWTKFKYAFIGTRPYTVRKFPKESVDQICAHCDHMQSEFDRRVQTLTIIRIGEIASTTNRVHDHGNRMHLDMRSLSDNVETQKSILINIREMLHDLLSNNEWQRDASERKTEIMRLQMENYQLGLERVRSLAPSEAPSEAVKKWFLWQNIVVDPKDCAQEAESMLRQGQTLTHAPGQVLKMFRNDRVKTFLTSAASGAIFVEAPMEGEEMSRCSSMSLACAMLLQDIAGQPYANTIHYFCGSHFRAQDPASGGIGIARILIGQLLCLQDFDFAFLNAEWRAELEGGNQTALFALFEPLVAQLKTPTLFCVIDGIVLFESKSRREETEVVISELLRVTGQCEHPVHLKLLVTGPSKSRIIASKFQQGEESELVKLRVDSDRSDVSMRAVKLEIANNRIRHSVSPSRPNLSSSSSFM